MPDSTDPIRCRDRAAIVDLFVKYCEALRTKDVGLLDHVLTPDGIVDYTRIGGAKAGLAVTKEWLRGLLTGVDEFYLYVGDSDFRFDQEATQASVTTTWHGLFVPIGGQALQVYGHYEDRVVLVEAGWRIAERIDVPAASVVATLQRG